MRETKQPKIVRLDTFMIETPISWLQVEWILIIIFLCLKKEYNVATSEQTIQPSIGIKWLDV